MVSDNRIKKIRRSFLAAFLVFLFITFGLRCFPLGCVFFDLEEITKILLFVGIPLFGIIYIMMELYPEKK